MFYLSREKKNLGRQRPEDSFPPELLNDTKENRKSHFGNYVVYHEFLVKAINDTVSSITDSVPERIIFGSGPSGVGKTELIEGVKEELMKLAISKLEENTGCIPLVHVQAVAPEKGSFDLPGLWRDTLRLLNEPMIDHKISYSEKVFHNSKGQIYLTSETKKADYRVVLQNCLKHREVMAMIIDEAHHMWRVATGKKADWTVDVIKSLANLSGTPIVLIGTYELSTYLEDLIKSSTDQVNQRTTIVEFPRYNANVTREINIFGKTAKLLLLNMPLKQTAEKLVDDDWKYFYKYSLGCIGSLKKWLMRAYSRALDLEATTLTREHLEATKISGKRCEGMLLPILEGEKRMKEIQSNGNLDLLLGFVERIDDSQNDSIQTPAKSGKIILPGNRIPVRDKVG